MSKSTQETVAICDRIIAECEHRALMRRIHALAQGEAEYELRRARETAQAYVGGWFEMTSVMGGRTGC